jgi:hypothetical protein
MAERSQPDERKTAKQGDTDDVRIESTNPPLQTGNTTLIQVPPGLKGVVVSETQLGDVRGSEGFFALPPVFGDRPQV